METDQHGNPEGTMAWQWARLSEAVAALKRDMHRALLDLWNWLYH